MPTTALHGYGNDVMLRQVRRDGDAPDPVRPRGAGGTSDAAAAAAARAANAAVKAHEKRYIGYRRR